MSFGAAHMRGSRGHYLLRCSYRGERVSLSLMSPDSGITQTVQSTASLGGIRCGRHLNLRLHQTCGSHVTARRGCSQQSGKQSRINLLRSIPRNAICTSSHVECTAHDYIVVDVYLPFSVFVGKIRCKTLSSGILARGTRPVLAAECTSHLQDVRQLSASVHNFVASFSPVFYSATAQRKFLELAQREGNPYTITRVEFR